MMEFLGGSTALVFLAYICVFQTSTCALSLTTELPRNRVRTGETAKFVCEAEGMQDGDVLRIMKKLEIGQTLELTIGQQLKSPYSDLGRYSITYSRKEGTEQIQSYQLVIQAVQAEDRGGYSCKVDGQATVVITRFLHVYGPVQSMYVGLTKSGKPQQKFRGRNNSVDYEILSHNSGQQLTCHVEGSIPMPQLKLLIGDRDITGHFISQSSNFTTSASYGFEKKIRSEIQLQSRLLPVFANESGQQLTCIATVPLYEPQAVLVTLNIVFPPQVTCNDVVAAPGDRNVIITCKGLANPRVTNDVWYMVKDGVQSRLRNSSHYSSNIEFLEDNKFLASLVIAEVHKGGTELFGTYGIQLSNSVGTSRPTTLELKKGKPVSAASVVAVSWINLIAVSCWFLFDEIQMI